jgi:cruciform cutting endonuclease 1
MAPRTVTAKALQALLTRIGSASSGTKEVLQARFKRDVAEQHLFGQRTGKGQRKSHPEKLRIISIDMGIKNLAFCDVEVDYVQGNSLKPTLDIIRWDKLNLVDATHDSLQHQPETPDTQNVKEGTKHAQEELDPYSLSVLSRTAYTFLRKSILEVSPDIILIERQRWRSASSAAIQQWTVRVNTLEAMLWAILSALKLEQSAAAREAKGAMANRQYKVYGVDPKRVGQFWLGQSARALAEKQDEAIASEGIDLLGGTVDQTTKKKEPRSKAEKKAKIAIIRSWFANEPASTAPSTPASAPIISFTVGPRATSTLKALSLPAPKTPRKKKAKAGDEDVVHQLPVVEETDIKKLDDITDSCLQVAAWVAWESNRRQLYDIWARKRGRNGKMPELDDEVLREMISVVGE